MSAYQITMREMQEAIEAVNSHLAYWAEVTEMYFVEDYEGKSLVQILAESRAARQEDERLQQEAEITAELNIPQHLIW